MRACHGSCRAPRMLSCRCLCLSVSVSPPPPQLPSSLTGDAGPFSRPLQHPLSLAIHSAILVAVTLAYLV